MEKKETREARMKEILKFYETTLEKLMKHSFPDDLDVYGIIAGVLAEDKSMQPKVLMNYSEFDKYFPEEEFMGKVHEGLQKAAWALAVEQELSEEQIRELEIEKYLDELEERRENYENNNSRGVK